MALTLALLVLFGIALMGTALVAGWAKVSPGEQAPDPVAEWPQLTVVVPVRDGAQTLAGLLQDLHAQRFPKELVRVVVVDDGSSDGTVALVKGMAAHWPQLELMQAIGEGKKAAITTALGTVQGGLVVQTDADVRCGPGRLASIASAWMHAPTDLLLLPVATEGEGWLGRIQEVEQCALFVVAAGSAEGGRPLLANGANLAYTAEAFHAVGGFTGDRQASGDDVHLVLRMQAAGRRIRSLSDQRAVVRTRAVPSLRAFLSQRLRWAGKMHALSWRHKALPALALAYPWVLLFITAGTDWVARVGHGAFHAGLLLLGCWCLWNWSVVRLARTGAAVLGLRDGRVATWVGMVLVHAYAPVIAVASFFVRPEWKGRRI